MSAKSYQASVMIMLHVTIPLGVIPVPAMKASLVKEAMEHVKVQKYIYSVVCLFVT